MHESTATVAPGQRATTVANVCPSSRGLRERLRAMAADLVASWRDGGMPAAVRSAPGLRSAAEVLVERAAAAPEHVGWTMVTIVSEYWRGRIASAANGRRLLLLPDCPCAAPGAGPVPSVCGPACGIATIWAAARDGGWVVESTRQAVSGIGTLLTGQYDGILGIARLADLEKAFAMLPAFALPVAALPCESAAAGDSCEAALAAAAVDVDWALGLLGVGGGEPVPVGDYLPLFREAAGMFTPEGLAALAERVGAEPSFGLAAAGVHTAVADLVPLEAAAALGGGFTTRGGKFLRPFVALAAFDAVVADLRESRAARTGLPADPASARDAAKAAAVAVEVFHKASLVHDDIEDDDRARYGRSTLHLECGVPSAINAGDYLLGIGYRIVAGLPGVDAATVRDVVAILASAHVRLARGQGAELWWRDVGGRRLSAAEALEMYGLKTSPAFEAAVAIGIRVAGVDPAAAAAIDRYALHVGTGFQVLNDLKDWAGDTENDRRAAGDLLGGRPTLLWALALERLSAVEVARLRALADEAGRASAPEVAAANCREEARRLFERADIFGSAVAIAAEQRQRAAAALASCRLRRLREVLEFLLDLAIPATERAAP